jgi:ABC-type transporter Mla MlaB component
MGTAALKGPQSTSPNRPVLSGDARSLHLTAVWMTREQGQNARKNDENAVSEIAHVDPANPQLWPSACRTAFSKSGLVRFTDSDA